MKLEEWIEVARLEAAKVGFTGFERALGELLKMERLAEKVGENPRHNDNSGDAGDSSSYSRGPKA